MASCPAWAWLSPDSKAACVKKAAKGDKVDIVVSGEGCEPALLKLVGLVKDGFGED